VQIFGLAGRAALPPAWQPLLDLQEKAMGLYRARRWDEAAAAFGAGRQAFPSDTVFGLYVDRCQHFLRNPPPSDWDGVWELKEK
jgi:adenylate cyclase